MNSPPPRLTTAERFAAIDAQLANAAARHADNEARLDRLEAILAELGACAGCGHLTCDCDADMGEDVTDSIAEGHDEDAAAALWRDIASGTPTLVDEDEPQANDGPCMMAGCGHQVDEHSIALNSDDRLYCTARRCHCRRYLSPRPGGAPLPANVEGILDEAAQGDGEPEPGSQAYADKYMSKSVQAVMLGDGEPPLTLLECGCTAPGLESLPAGHPVHCVPCGEESAVAARGFVAASQPVLYGAKIDPARPVTVPRDWDADGHGTAS